MDLNYKYPSKDLSKVVEYISVSLIQEASSLEKKIFTAIDSPFQIPRQTSPYLGIILKEKEFGFATFQLICKYLHLQVFARTFPCQCTP